MGATRPLIYSDVRYDHDAVRRWIVSTRVQTWTRLRDDDGRDTPSLWVVPLDRLGVACAHLSEEEAATPTSRVAHTRDDVLDGLACPARAEAGDTYALERGVPLLETRRHRVLTSFALGT
jgi:hypothetical protein